MLGTTTFHKRTKVIMSNESRALSRRDAALQYARNGYVVFPIYSATSTGACTCENPKCEHIGKHPLSFLKGWSNPEWKPDVAQVDLWWTQNPTYNIGLRLDGLAA